MISVITYWYTDTDPECWYTEIKAQSKIYPLGANSIAHINEVTLRQARLVLGWLTVSIPGAGHLSWYVTSHPGQLSLAIHSWVATRSTSESSDKVAAEE